MPKQYTTEFKKHHVDAWCASGLTRHQYAGSQGINEGTFKHWPSQINAKNNISLLPNCQKSYRSRLHALLPLMYRATLLWSICPVAAESPAKLLNSPMSSGPLTMLKPEHLFLAVKPVDMRRGIDTMTQYVQETLNASWHEGAAFVFANKSRTRIKVLRWDKHGVWLCARRLHKGHFIWPRANDMAWSLTPDQFEWQITGIDWQKVQGHDLSRWVHPSENRPDSPQ